VKNAPLQSAQPMPARWWLIVTVAAFWVVLLIHEGAHFITAWFLYSDQVRASDEALRRANTFVVSAGPLATLAVIVTSTVVAIRRGRFGPINIAAMMSAVSRVIVMSPVVISAGTGINDESAVAKLLQISHRWIWFGEFVVTVLALVVSRNAFRASGAPIKTVVLGVCLGWVLAKLLGPLLGLPV